MTTLAKLIVTWLFVVDMCDFLIGCSRWWVAHQNLFTTKHAEYWDTKHNTLVCISCYLFKIDWVSHFAIFYDHIAKKNKKTIFLLY